MTTITSDYQKAVLDDLNDSSELARPVKASLAERMLLRSASPDDLHPNPEDEFSNAEIGPNYTIVGNYGHDLLEKERRHPDMEIEPITVQKLSTGGYRILNGHHRWLAAKKLHIDKVPIQIVNTIGEDEIIAQMEHMKGEMCASFDLDEVLICDPDIYPAEKLPFPVSRVYPQPIRKNAGLLIKVLRDLGFDVWVYTGTYQSRGYIRNLLALHHGSVSGVINGMRTKKVSPEIRKSFRDKYRFSVHIDTEKIIWLNTRSKEYEVIDVASKEYWANRVSGKIKKQLRIEAAREKADQ